MDMATTISTLQLKPGRMKKLMMTLGIALLYVSGSTTFVACSQAPTEEVHEHATEYQCPMQCEGDKTYAEAGKCPKCGMDMDELVEHDNVQEHDHEHTH